MAWKKKLFTLASANMAEISGSSTTGTTGSSSSNPWWTGAPTTLLRKTNLVSEAPNRLPVHTLTFAIPDGTSFTSPATSHRNLRLERGDVVKMVIPNYKPKSYSVSDLRHDDNEFDVTLKVYPNGRASGYLDRIPVGGTVQSFGKHARRTHNAGRYVGIIAYGVGITEGFPVARAECRRLQREFEEASGPNEVHRQHPRVTLLWASRTMADTFWHEPIRKLQEEYPDIFRLVHILSRETKGDCLHGRIDASVLSQVFDVPDDQRDEARFLSIGTKEMMKQTDGMLAEIGFAMPKHWLLPKPPS